MSSGTIALAKLETRKIVRNRRVMIFSIALPVMLFEIFSNSSKSTVGGEQFKTYYMVAMAGYGSLAGALMGNTMRISTENKMGWIRQLRLSTLPGSSYFVGKMASTLAIVVPSIVLLFIAGAAQGVSMDAWKWAVIGLSVLLGSMIFTGLGLALGLRYDPDSVQPIVMIVFFGMSILGGFWGPIGGENLQKYFGRWLPTGAVRQIGQDVVGKGHVDLLPFLVIIAWGVVFTVLANLSFRANQPD